MKAPLLPLLTTLSRNSRSRSFNLRRYQFQGKVGQSVSISLESDEFNPVLQLFYVDQSGPQPKYVPISKNDDWGPADFAAQLHLSLPKDGLYYIGAISFQKGALGN